MNFVKNAAAGAVLGGSLLFTAGLGMATAQPAQAPDGLVNLSVGDVTLLESVTADTAATAASALCTSVPGDVSALAAGVDSDGVEQTVCSGLPGGDLVVTQNASNSSTAPAEESAPEGDTGSAEGDTGTDTDTDTGTGDTGAVPQPSAEG
jgi:hypothetical protein